MTNMIMGMRLSFTPLILILGVSDIQAQSRSAGEPVPGAEIHIELDTDGQAVMRGKTDHIGTYHFRELRSGTYRLICQLPEGFDAVARKARLGRSQRLHINFIVDGIQRSPITFGSKTGKNPLLFESPPIVLEGRNTSFKITVVTSVNNYGINDEGIK